MSEWKEYGLHEIASFSQGKQIPVSEQFENKLLELDRFIRIVDFTSDWTQPPRYVKKDDKYKVGKNDIVMLRYGTPGKVFRGHEGIIANNMFKISPDESIVTKEYLYWFLYQDSVYKILMANQSSSTMPAISFKMLSCINVKVPSFETQQHISSFFDTLDEKIAVNKKICENLEAQAQALFKHWFVDFAPFKDGKFVESELGLIPEGWRVGTYDEIIQDTISGDWGKEKPEGNYTHKVACIRGCDFQDVKMGLRGKTPERYILEKNYDSKHFNDKDVLVEISGGTATVSTGRICPVSQLLIDKYNGDIVCTNFCRLVRPCVGYSSYLYYSWKYKYDKKVMFGYENGTSGIKNFSIKDFTSREPLIIPRLSDLQIFEDIVEHIHTHIQNIGSESAKLATLRDTLLPKLMSGQIKL